MIWGNEVEELSYNQGPWHKCPLLVAKENPPLLFSHRLKNVVRPLTDKKEISHWEILVKTFPRALQLT